MEEIHTHLDVLTALPAPDIICFAKCHGELQEGQIYQAKKHQLRRVTFRIELYAVNSTEHLRMCLGHPVLRGRYACVQHLAHIFLNMWGFFTKFLSIFCLRTA